MTRADLVAEIAAFVPAHGDPWAGAEDGFRVVVGRAPCERWGAITPSEGARVEDAVCCFDAELIADAITHAGLEP